MRRAPASEPDWLTLGQAAKFLGVAQSTIRKWSDQGRVPAFYTPGGHRRFRRGDLESFIDSSGPGHPPSGPLVLVVDDDSRLRAYLRVNLEFAGYAVVEAENGEQALAAIEDQAPELVLLDVVMPGIDGWQLLRQVEERHGSIPVIMFSGQVDDEAAAEAASRGARGFVGKPFDPDELLARAKQLVPV
jgi:excisionase family DNA binding protein